MGWPMGWDGIGSKTGYKTGSKQHPRMTYAGPILALTYDPAGPYPYASMYMAAIA